MPAPISRSSGPAGDVSTTGAAPADETPEQASARKLQENSDRADRDHAFQMDMMALQQKMNMNQFMVTFESNQAKANTDLLKTLAGNIK